MRMDMKVGCFSLLTFGIFGFRLKKHKMLKKIVHIIVLSSLVFGCKNNVDEKPAFAKAETTTLTPFDHNVEEEAVIYEANIRQYSPEGTFNAFTKDIPVLKELGVKIIWVMPIFPISKTKRKGSLGSYYAVSDFREVNPEFGTLEDVDEMIAEAHRYDTRLGT